MRGSCACIPRGAAGTWATHQAGNRQENKRQNRLKTLWRTCGKGGGLQGVVQGHWAASGQQGEGLADKRGQGADGAFLDALEAAPADDGRRGEAQRRQLV